MDELSNEVHLNDKLRFLLKRIQQKSLNTQRFVFLFHNADKLAFSDTSTLVNLSKLYIGTLPSELRTLIMRKASLTDMQTVAQVDSDIEVGFIFSCAHDKVGYLLDMQGLFPGIARNLYSPTNGPDTNKVNDKLIDVLQ